METSISTEKYSNFTNFVNKRPIYIISGFFQPVFATGSLSPKRIRFSKLNFFLTSQTIHNFTCIVKAKQYRTCNSKSNEIQ